MTKISGSAVLARALKRRGTNEIFFLMGGPMLEAENACIREGIRMIDVRHEQAAALMAQAQSRLLQKPGVCMAASGPGVINLTTGLANALIDCSPVVAIGGSAPIRQIGRGTFQEIDQIEVMKGCVKWSERVYDPMRIPEHVNNAFQNAINGKPGPVYLDLPHEVLNGLVEEEDVDWSACDRPLAIARSQADPERVQELVAALHKAKRPLILSGSGVIWSRGWDEMRQLVEKAGIPFFTTPQGRGVVPDDHDLSFLSMRSTAFKETDFILVLGTRMNYIISQASAPRFNADAVIARIDIDATEISTAPRRVDIPLVGDCKAVLTQILAALGDKVTPHCYQEWRKKLSDGAAAKADRARSETQPREAEIHPRQLCEAINGMAARDAILAVDGQDILNFGRQTMPTFMPGHRLNSGPFGMMGVGLPFALGAKIACPDKQVICVHGDGSFGLNAMELDTAVRHNIPILVVISLNGGWTGDPKKQKPGRDLGYTRFDLMAEALGCYGVYIEKLEDLQGALVKAQREVDKGRVAVVNVRTDFRAQAETFNFASYVT
jgi:thiamine pyrophosphate-dependent acetolactate synthase large subunit-like protein